MAPVYAAEEGARVAHRGDGFMTPLPLEVVRPWFPPDSTWQIKPNGGGGIHKSANGSEEDNRNHQRALRHP